MAKPEDNKPQITRRQHWLPQTSYLENFTLDGKVKTYWYGSGGKADFINTAEQKDIAPINIGVKKDLYETPSLPVNSMENALAYLEGLYLKVLREKILLHKPLTQEEHDQVALYISALENRTMLQKQHLNNTLDKIEEMGRSMAMGHDAPEAAERWTKQIDATREELFPQAIAIALQVDKWAPLDFCFLVPSEYVKARFITSDHPVSITDYTMDNSPYGLTHWHKTAECIVPLTPEIALFGNMCGITGYKELDYNFVREVNNRVLRRSDKMLISKETISQTEAKAIIHRNPQSLILKFADLPEGSADKMLREAKDKDPKEAKKLSPNKKTQ